MTVRELMEILENYDEDAPVLIGMYQTYGSNFVMNICEVDEEDGVRMWDDDDVNPGDCVILIEGGQIGTLKVGDDDE